MTAAVWMGYEQPRAMESFRGREVSGGTWPAKIWRDFMEVATEGDEDCDFPTTDAGERIVNQSLASQRTTTTVAPQRRSTTSTSVAPSGSSTSVPRSTTSTQAPSPTTTAAPPPPTTAAPTTTAAPPPPTTAAPGG